MAYVSTRAVTESSLEVDIQGLSQAQNKYSGFRFRINGGSWRSVSRDPYYTGYDSPNYTFTGLSAGTSYYIEGEALTNSWYPADPKWATTSSPPRTPAPTGFSMYATSHNEILFSWGYVSGASSYEVGIYSPISNSRTTSSTSLYWGGLSSGTTYYAQVRAYSYSGGWSDWSNYDYATTPQPPKTQTPTGFSMSAVNSSTIRGSWYSVSGASYYEWAFYSPTSQSKIVYGTSYDWSGLSPNTTYYGQVRAYSSLGGWSDWSSYSTAKTPLARPANFSWNLAKLSGERFNLTAVEWNGLTARINAFRAYRYQSTYSFTNAYVGGTFTAGMYNEARNAIYSMNSNIPNYRNTGDIIYATEIDALRTSLNAIS